jgi:predicted nucleic-acid-binding protein
MRALDTNVLARLLLKDDVLQFKKARHRLASNERCTAPATDMLELVWVLESKDEALLTFDKSFVKQASKHCQSMSVRRDRLHAVVGATT